MAHEDAVSGLSGPESYDPWGGDTPVFDPKCHKCGRFLKGDVSVAANGFGDIISARAFCTRCGTVEASISHWKSDEEAVRGR